MPRARIGSQRRVFAAAAIAGTVAIWTWVPAAEEPVFPRGDLVDAQATFWTSVYGKWSLSQVAVHDKQCPSMIYEVIDLPGAVGEAYTPAQQAFVGDVRAAWEARLAEIEGRVDAGAPLSDDEKSLALRVTDACGTDGLRGASLRVRSQRGLRERFRRGLAVSARYDVRFREIFREAGLPEDLALLPHVESSFQHTARSSAGAVGVWQFTRATGRKFMRVNAAVDERLDPVASARGAARYLRAAHDTLGSWPLALTSYNHGVAGMTRARAQFGDDFEAVVRAYDAPTFGFASKNFYAEFLAAREVALHPEVYFPEGVSFEEPLAMDEVPLPRAMTIHQVQSRYGVDRATLRRLNPAWSAKAAAGRIALPVGHRIWLPEGTLAGRPATPETTLAEAAAPSPAPAAKRAHRYHKVRPGDTLWSVAKRYGLEVAELRKMNGLGAKASRIRPGQRLRVGDAS
ncbi:MAG TPA: transglycosylase SLT domain-containing protein [Candidatus Polarisedimenticolaceae bacterium]|nr:transglycosylase SLT domain-containing protein [Candidatus Polarisedimenticolaceae bacterium]